MRQVKGLSFAGQNIYCAIDVHEKGWSVSIRAFDFLTKNYPEANYYAVYEAGSFHKVLEYF